jgi:thiamine-monophosphate kinase
MPLSEFDLIDKYFKNALSGGPEVRCGIGDDAAIVSVPQGMELALSMDTLVAGVHFPETTAPADIGHKALAVNLSDMAAMGAEPRWITLSLTLPQDDPASWLEAFMSGFSALAGKYSLALIGGDLAHGPLSITIEIHGWLPAGTAIYRSGARPGDRIYVSGTLGDAGLALGVLDQRWSIDRKYHAEIFNRLYRPVPRTALGMALRGLATSAIDISDGLQADLAHILEASRAGARLDPGLLPLSEALRQLPLAEAWEIALTAGDDYELCFTLPAAIPETEIKRLSAITPVHCIGQVTTEAGMYWQRLDGSVFVPAGTGYKHFRNG